MYIFNSTYLSYQLVLICNNQSILDTIIVFLNLTADFDTSNHSILINGLANAGFTGKALDQLSSYFAVRNSYVSIDDKISLDIHLGIGVPQGSVMEPILFNNYIAPLLTMIDTFSSNISFHSYVDDIQIYIRANNPNYPFAYSLLR